MRLKTTLIFGLVCTVLGAGVGFYFSHSLDGTLSGGLFGTLLTSMARKVSTPKRTIPRDPAAPDEVESPKPGRVTRPEP